MRIAAILRSMSSREATRIDLALTRAGYLVAAFLAFLPFAGRPGMVFGAGWWLQWAFLLPSFVLVLFLAVRLAGDAVGDLDSGFLDLIFITGLKPRQWIAVRFIQMWTGFLSVWLVRIPLYFFLLAFGGIHPYQILVTELLLITGFLLMSSFALNGAFKTKSRQQVWSRVMLSMLVWEFLMRAPNLTAGVLSGNYGVAIPIRVLDWANDLAAMSLSSQLFGAMAAPATLERCLPTFALYGFLSAVVYFRFLRRLQAASQGRVQAPGADRFLSEEEHRGPRRDSRRCWDDALAWQAFCIHGYGKRLVQVKCAVYSLIGAGLVLSIPFGYKVLAFILATVACAIALMISVNKPSDCLAREIRDQTMTALLLTPHDSIDFYKGWRRGAWHLGWPDMLLALILTFAAWSLSPMAPPVVVSLVVAALFSGPFMMLSPLVPFTPGGIATGLGLTFFAIVIAVVCIIVGFAVHPYVVPCALIPGALLFNSIIQRRVLPYWMERKISSIV